jgi:RNA polymerase sigma-70 factor (ECF subfamily)
MTHDFRDLLLSEMPRMRGYALALTRDRSAADDLLQETAVKAWQAQAQFTLGTNFKAWIYRILRNEFLTTCRRKTRAPVSIELLAPEFFGREGDQEAHVITGEVLRAMDQLSKDQREALLLAAGSGLGYQEIADTLRCSIGTVKSRLWRARTRMQVFLLGKEAADALTEQRRKESSLETTEFAFAPAEAGAR